MTTTDFLTEALARAAEHEGDVDLTTAPVFGVVFYDADGPCTIDVYAGQTNDVKRAAEYMVTYQNLDRYSLVPFGRLTENRSKADLIRETALVVTDGG